MAALFYAAQEYLREMLHSKVARVDKLPWNIPTLLRDSVAFESFKAAHTLACERHQSKVLYPEQPNKLKLKLHAASKLSSLRLGTGRNQGRAGP